jgi:hypothetical protein
MQTAWRRKAISNLKELGASKKCEKRRDSDSDS